MQNPIHKVLSTISGRNVRALLMGGQACVLYGAAEFSRDTDLALLASDENIELLRVALRNLQARRVALPPFEQKFLHRGHAIHFRCYHPEALGMRVDIMSVMRGVDPFEHLWERRTTIMTDTGGSIEMVSLPDLVKAKKTQRDKDWPMIRRLIEADYASQENPSLQQVKFWMLESRTPKILFELSRRRPEHIESLKTMRPLLSLIQTGDRDGVELALDKEEKAEREADRRYWEPLRKELEELRRRNYSIEEEVF